MASRMWLLLVVLCAPAGAVSLKHAQQEKLAVNLLSAVPEKARVLEIDCVTASKHLYHLPNGCAVTQWFAAPP